MDKLSKAVRIALLALALLPSGFPWSSTVANAQTRYDNKNCVLPPGLIAQESGAFVEQDAILIGGALAAEAQKNKVKPEWLRDAAKGRKPGEKPVAIVLIDDFSEEQRSHGYHVEYVVQKLMAAANAGSNITIERVPINFTAGITADDLAERLKSITLGLRANHDRFVINMSFVLFPCTSNDVLDRDQQPFRMDNYLKYYRETYKGVEGNDLSGAGTLLNFLGDPKDNGTPVKLNQLLRSPYGSQDAIQFQSPPRTIDEVLKPNFLKDNALENEDSLRGLIAGFTATNEVRGLGGTSVAMVAAAGNFAILLGDPMPLYPARWPEVIAVSASIGTQPDTRTSWSNKGHVVVPGAYYAFDDGSLRSGTSYSAPGVATALALYILSYQPMPCGPYPSSRGILVGIQAYNDISLRDVLSQCQLP